MRRQGIIFWIGLLIFAVSFALIAVGDTTPRSAPMQGYQCAVFAFIVPLRNSSDFHVPPSDIFIFISAWTNVVFLGFLLVVLLARSHLGLSLFRFFILSTIPFPWMAFYYGPYYPREGYFLWLAGILLVVFYTRTPSRARIASQIRSPLA